MSFKTAETVLSAAVAASGTFTLSYPTGTDGGSFAGGSKHKLWAAGLQKLFLAPDNFTVAFGTTNITVTYNGTTSLPAGSRVNVQLAQVGDDDNAIKTKVDDTKRLGVLTPYVIRLGAPDTADADGVATSQTVTGGGTIAIAGALAFGGVATFDQPRNVVGAWTGSGTITITGTDEYGEAVVETTAAAGVAHTGKKAFKTVTSVVPSSNMNTITIGSGDVLGLPVAVPQKGMVVGELEDGGNATAGTVVAAVTSVATATTGDVRGTYDPNSACDGSKAFELLVLMSDPTDLGVDQYAG
jgi:hypothetical protein